MKRIIAVMLCIMMFLSLPAYATEEIDTVKNGWITENGNLYYYINGEQATGWITVDDFEYYLKEDGSAAIGQYTIDDQRYFFDIKGKLIESAQLLVIDVSYYQGNIDWKKLIESGIDAVILRSSYGNKLEDPNFKTYVKQLNELEIPYGIYHYSTAEDIEEATFQAKRAVSIIRDAGAKPTLPVFADIEEYGGKYDLITLTKVYIEEFIKSGYTPGVYANKNYWEKYLNEPLFDVYYKWIAAYGLNDGNAYLSSMPENYDSNYGLWQYTDKGIVDGVDSTYVDLNLMFDSFYKQDGFVSFDGKQYYYESGKISYGWKRIDDKWYCFDSYGAAYTDKWMKDSIGWCYLGADGVMATQMWVQDSVGWCYVGEDGYCITNAWRKDELGFCYLDENGRMAKETWVEFEGGKCYLNEAGYASIFEFESAENTSGYFDFQSGVLTVNGNMQVLPSKKLVPLIKKVNLLGGTDTIADALFKDCTNLTSVFISSSIINIGESAFENCTAITEILYSGSKEKFYSINISPSNDVLSLTQVSYDRCSAGNIHIYDDNCDGFCNFCDEERNSTHSFGEFLYDNNATLTSDGTKTRVCSQCRFKETVIAEGTKLHTNGWALEDGKWVFYQNGTKVSNTWKKDSVGWCYLGSDGRMATDKWVKDSVGWCYVGKNGYCVTNTWMKDSIGWCYLDNDGRMATDKWVKDSVGWCYVGKNGYCVTNTWMKDSIGWCYLGSDGRMVKNTYVYDSNGLCYIDSNGYWVA